MSIFTELGVKTFIHAGGTKTTHGGTRMHEDVLKAIVEASKCFVDVRELNCAIGKYIAKISGAEAGMVTSGAASGLVLSMAACMTGTDIVKVLSLPNAEKMKNELIIQKIHRGAYSHMYTFSGAKFIEIGDINGCLAEELNSAIGEKTAAIAYLLGPRILPIGLSLPEVVEIAHSKNIPVILDAAAMLPPKSNLSKYIQQGADLVVFSGGKFIHGPQATGLLFGRKDLIEAAIANASPNHSIGRPHKVSKEDMIGLYVALKRLMEVDEEELIKKYINILTPILEEIKGIEGLQVDIVSDDVNYNVPNIIINFNDKWKGPTQKQILKILANGEPPIFMQYFKGINHLAVNPISLQDGEEKIIAKQLYNIFTGHTK